MGNRLERLRRGRCVGGHDAHAMHGRAEERTAAIAVAREHGVPAVIAELRLPDEVVRDTFPWEEYVLARSLVSSSVLEGAPEDDLFAGLRAGAVDRA